MDTVLLIAGGAAFAAVRVLQTRGGDGKQSQQAGEQAGPASCRPLSSVQDSAMDLERVPQEKHQRPGSPVGVLCNHADLSFVSLGSEASSSEEPEEREEEVQPSRSPAEPDPPLVPDDPRWALHECASEVDVKDAQSPDRWVKRHRQLIRLTGRCGRRAGGGGAFLTFLRVWDPDARVACFPRFGLQPVRKGVAFPACTHVAAWPTRLFATRP